MLGMFLWAVGGSAVLVLLYQHVRLNWPESYFGPSETAARFISKSGPRYAAFRFVPPFLVFVVIGIYGPDPSRTTIWVTAALYGIVSTVLSIRSSHRAEPGSVRLSSSRVAVLITILAGLVGTAWAADATASAMAPSAPPLSDVVANLLASLIAAVLAVAFFVGTRNLEIPSYLPEDFQTSVRAIALDCGADPQLAVSIAHVEGIERPPWFRSVERVTYKLRKRGTYGLFQVVNERPVSDMDSAYAALSRLRGIFPLKSCGYPVTWSVQRAAEKHNPDHNFAKMVGEVYPHYTPFPIGATVDEAPDGRPLLEILLISRFSDTIALRGTLWSATEEVAIDVYEPLELQPYEIAPTVVLNVEGRSTWRAVVKADVISLNLRIVSPLEGCFTSQSLTVDLRHEEPVRDPTIKDLDFSPALHG